MKSSFFAITTATLSFGVMGIAQAGTIIVPESLSTTMGSQGTAILDNMTNQEGLSVLYTAGDDFDTYLAGNPTHDTYSNGMSVWASSVGITEGSITYDFGSAVTLESLALWNSSPLLFLGIAIINFSLEASLTSDFSSANDLGEFLATIPSNNPTTAEVFPFTPTKAQFIRLNVLSNNGGPQASIGEVIFEESQDTESPGDLTIPEPSSLLGLFLIGGAGLFAKKRQK
ncbi:MAG: PEP-CTERM sorting domain-containing protein [Microcystaceae cyanobacterium]